MQPQEYEHTEKLLTRLNVILHCHWGCW